MGATGDFTCIGASYRLTFKLFKNIFTDCPSVMDPYWNIDGVTIKHGVWYWYLAISFFYSMLVFFLNLGGRGQTQSPCQELHFLICCTINHKSVSWAHNYLTFLLNRMMYVYLEYNKKYISCMPTGAVWCPHGFSKSWKYTK